jgi:hypothetical protein
MDTALIELTVVRRGASEVGEQRALSRDVDRGLLVRIRRGVYVGAPMWAAATPEERHVLRMRALTAVSSEEPVFSHWSAAVVLGLPVLDRARLERVHVTRPPDARRSIHGATLHHFAITEAELVRVDGLLLTNPVRTTVDVLTGSGFVEGVVTADGALHSGIRRTELEERLDLVGFRRGSSIAADGIAFSHRDAEAVTESLSRTSMLVLGIAPMELQHRFFDHLGFVARSDFWDPEQRIAGEADGMVKFLDPRMAPRGAGREVWKEKRREDRLLGCTNRIARWGYEEAISPTKLGLVLGRVGLLPDRPMATLQDYIEAARPFG